MKVARVKVGWEQRVHGQNKKQQTKRTETELVQHFENISVFGAGREVGEEESLYGKWRHELPWKSKQANTSARGLLVAPEQPWPRVVGHLNHVY